MSTNDALEMMSTREPANTDYPHPTDGNRNIWSGGRICIVQIEQEWHSARQEARLLGLGGYQQDDARHIPFGAVVGGLQQRAHRAPSGT